MTLQLFLSLSVGFHCQVVFGLEIPPEPSDSMTARSEHSNTAEAQENDLTLTYEYDRSPYRRNEKILSEKSRKRQTKKNEKKIKNSPPKIIKHVRKTVQDLKIEIKTIKKTQTKGSMKMENLGKQIGIQMQASQTEYKR